MTDTETALRRANARLLGEIERLQRLIRIATAAMTTLRALGMTVDKFWRELNQGSDAYLDVNPPDVGK